MSETYTEILARSRTARNAFQGPAKRVLCLCSAGLLRSPTAAWVLSNPPYNFNTRAAGIVPEYALIQVDDVLIGWADEIVCLYPDVYQRLKVEHQTGATPIIVLDVPDRFERMAPELIHTIRLAYDQCMEPSDER